jgi:acyl-coenzyme A thioesterase PaaI-like protein
VAAIFKVYPASYATTINLQLSYMKPVLEGRFWAVGKCVKAGKMVLFSKAQVFDERKAGVQRSVTITGNSMATQGLSSEKYVL